MEREGVLFLQSRKAAHDHANRSSFCNCPHSAGTYRRFFTVAKLKRRNSRCFESADGLAIPRQQNPLRSHKQEHSEFTQLFSTSEFTDCQQSWPVCVSKKRGCTET